MTNHSDPKQSNPLREPVGDGYEFDHLTGKVVHGTPISDVETALDAAPPARTKTPVLTTLLDAPPEGFPVAPEDKTQEIVGPGIGRRILQAVYGFAAARVPEHVQREGYVKQLEQELHRQRIENHRKDTHAAQQEDIITHLHLQKERLEELVRISVLEGTPLAAFALTLAEIVKTYTPEQLPDDETLRAAIDNVYTSATENPVTPEVRLLHFMAGLANIFAAHRDAYREERKQHRGEIDGHLAEQAEARGFMQNLGECLADKRNAAETAQTYRATQLNAYTHIFDSLAKVLTRHAALERRVKEQEPYVTGINHVTGVLQTLCGLAKGQKYPDSDLTGDVLREKAAARRKTNPKLAKMLETGAEAYDRLHAIAAEYHRDESRSSELSAILHLAERENNELIRERDHQAAALETAVETAVGVLAAVAERYNDADALRAYAKECAADDNRRFYAPVIERMVEVEKTDARSDKETAKQAYQRAKPFFDAKDFTAALPELFLAYSLDKHHPWAALDIGKSLQAMNALELAKPYFEQARQTPGDAQTWACCHLGQIYEAQGKPAEAQQHYKNALQFFGENRWAQERLKKLKHE